MRLVLLSWLDSWCPRLVRPTRRSLSTYPRHLLTFISFILGSCLQLAGMVQDMVMLVHPDTNIAGPWQTTLIVFAFVILAVCFNIFFARHLPLAEGVVLFLHIFAFFAFLLTLWIMADHAPASEVFTSFK